MIGRSLIAHPWMLESLKTIDTEHIIEHNDGIKKIPEQEMTIPNYEKFRQFHDELLEGYVSYLSGDRNVLFRMKELWSYWGRNFVGQEKLLKQIKKANTLKEYQAVLQLLGN